MSACIQDAWDFLSMENLQSMSSREWTPPANHLCMGPDKMSFKGLQHLIMPLYGPATKHAHHLQPSPFNSGTWCSPLPTMSSQPWWWLHSRRLTVSQLPSRLLIQFLLTSDFEPSLWASPHGGHRYSQNSEDASETEQRWEREGRPKLTKHRLQTGGIGFWCTLCLTDHMIRQS